MVRYMPDQAGEGLYVRIVEGTTCMDPVYVSEGVEYETTLGKIGMVKLLTALSKSYGVSSRIVKNVMGDATTKDSGIVDLLVCVCFFSGIRVAEPGFAQGYSRDQIRMPCLHSLKAGMCTPSMLLASLSA
jgi:hypothetical protein